MENGSIRILMKIRGVKFRQLRDELSPPTLSRILKGLNSKDSTITRLGHALSAVEYIHTLHALDRLAASGPVTINPKFIDLSIIPEEVRRALLEQHPLFQPSRN